MRAVACDFTGTILADYGLERGVARFAGTHNVTAEVEVAVRMWIEKASVFFVVTVLIASCALPPNQQVPVAENPTGGNPTSVPTTTTDPDSRLPEWLKIAAPFQLIGDKDYTGLETIFLPERGVFPGADGRIVGSPYIQIAIKGYGSSPSGKLNFGFEDSVGFAYLQDVPTVMGLSAKTSTSLDMIFSDDRGVFRAQGPITGSTWDATLLYRVRDGGENQCRTYCQQVCAQGATYWDPVAGAYQCAQWVTTTNCQVEVDPCRAYIDSSNSDVVDIGSFEAQYLGWVTP